MRATVLSEPGIPCRRTSATREAVNATTTINSDLHPVIRERLPLSHWLSSPESLPAACVSSSNSIRASPISRRRFAGLFSRHRHRRARRHPGQILTELVAAMPHTHWPTRLPGLVHADEHRILLVHVTSDKLLHAAHAPFCAFLRTPVIVAQSPGAWASSIRSQPVHKNRQSVFNNLPRLSLDKSEFPIK